MKPLSRRLLLRGAGTLMALPLLEAMLPRTVLGQTAPKPRRFVGFYVPCGMNMSKWTPAATGAGWQATQALQPIIDAGLKNDVLVLSGLANTPARPDGPGDHASGTGAFLTASHPFKTSAANISNGISVDQVVANALRSYTRFGSLELGIDGGGNSGDCDSGYSCAYAHNISWASATQPLAKETNPQAVFDRLFGMVDPNQTTAAVAKRKLYQQSVIDSVKDDASRLQSRLGKTDRRKMDEYLTGVRQLEVRIATDQAATTVCAPGARPGGYTDIRDKTTQMLDLIAYAFQCDLTRVATFMMQNAGSDYTYSFLGVSDGHHTMSHHGGDSGKLANLALINAWEVKQLAYLLAKLKGITEPDGNVLDNSLVFFSSEIEDGDSHSHNNMPIIVGGKGGGAFTPGRHVKYTAQEPVANLFLSMINGLGVTAASIGNSTGQLAQL